MDVFLKKVQVEISRLDVLPHLGLNADRLRAVLFTQLQVWERVELMDEIQIPRQLDGIECQGFFLSLGQF